MANLTILDVLRRNSADPEVGIIEESMALHPEITMGAAKQIAGTTYKTVVRTALPSVGFRSVNEGVATTRSTLAIRTADCFLVDCGVEVDKAMAQVGMDPLEEILADELAAHAEAGARSLASQFYYGTLSTVGAASSAASATKGFPGLIDTYDSTNMEISRGGASGAYTSVWLVKFGPQYLRWIVGADGMLDVKDAYECRLTDGSSNPYDGLRKPMSFWVGLQNVNPRHSAVRIKLIDAGTSPTAGLSDAYIAKALTLFKAGMRPDLILMTPNTLYQLQSSRTATNPTGAPAPFPDNAFGIPIVTTDAISEVETA